MPKKKPVRKVRKNARKKPFEVVILDDNPLSIACYIEEYKEKYGVDTF